MRAIIYTLPERYVIADLDTGEILGYQSSLYRCRQEAANQDAEEIIECTGKPSLSITHSEDLQLALSSGSEDNGSDNKEASVSGSKSPSSGRGRGTNSGKAYGATSETGDEAAD